MIPDPSAPGRVSLALGLISGTIVWLVARRLCKHAREAGLWGVTIGALVYWLLWVVWPSHGG